tara:strand:+ start:65 stop:916 length:852 start_codon:yes stop_codon:yes gene_type:complete
MRPKKDKSKQYVAGGMIALQAGLAGAQALQGMAQRRSANAEMERLKSIAPSLDTPSQYYENYKNAYDNAMAEMETDSINRSYSSSLSALQGAGGRAVVGGLPAIEQQRQGAQNQMLAQERQMRLNAGNQLAAAEDATVRRKFEQSINDQSMANAAFQAGTQNIGNAVLGAGENLAYMYAAGDNSDDAGSGGGMNLLNKLNTRRKLRRAQTTSTDGQYMAENGMMTPGEFSHKSNPIDLVQDGQKIGEATGGEFIINKEQAASIAKQSDFAKNLFKKFAKNINK